MPVVAVALPAGATFAPNSVIMTKEAKLTTIEIESTMGLLIQDLAEVARNEGAGLIDGPPHAVAQAYLFGKVPTAFRVVVPARSAVNVTIPMPNPSARRGIAVASAIGLLASHQLCEQQITHRYNELIAGRALAQALSAFCAASACLAELGVPTAFTLQRDYAEKLLRGLEDAETRTPKAFSTLSPPNRMEALLMNVTRTLASAMGPGEIARLVDDGQGGSPRQKVDRTYRRVKALAAWPDGCSEGFVVGTFEADEAPR